MKVLLILSVLALAMLGMADGTTHSRGCIYIMGRCYKECEVGTHAYTTGCGKLTREATCDNPNPQPEEGAICDYSACYCDTPTLRDNISGKCVQPEECPKKTE